MRALVTGAAGFIGSALVDRLLDDGHQVVGVDNFWTGVPDNLERALSGDNSLSHRFSLVEADIQVPELTDIVAGVNPDVIFHLAARVEPDDSAPDPQVDARNNVLGTINLCEASRRTGVRRIVYAASGDSRYGAPACHPVDERRSAEPLSSHAVSKLAGELYLRAYSEMYGLAPICLALSNVYGPRQRPHGVAGMITILSSAMITGLPYVVHRDRVDAHDYVYVDDVVEAFVRAGSAPLDITGIYNIGTGEPTTAVEVYQMIAAILDGCSPPGTAADGRDQLPATMLNTTKAERELGWKPTVSLADGIDRTLHWLRATLESDTSTADYLAVAGAR